MNVKKKKSNQMLSNMITYTILFATFVNRYVYATDDTIVDNILIDVTQVLLVIAGLLCLGKLIHIGILYMTSSAVEKSQAKTALMPWLVGTIVAFGASWIGPAIINIIKIDRGPLDY
ncbi:MAG: hypothetical protein IJ220_05385 [Clostridia bacterium]|nr:hypothetical protein [Clostridia bacterium]